MTALGLCAVLHGVPEEPRASLPLSATASATTPDPQPHGPHNPHDPHHPHDTAACAADAFARTAAQAAEDLPLGAMAPAVLVAVSLVIGRPLARPYTLRRRRGARTGRAALVRTSRWRI
ncbi:hypothetical protein ICC28_34375 [Streptomyces sp. TRM68416]|nr:hypothetical protein [Streptomyces sp. TRM68416]